MMKDKYPNVVAILKETMIQMGYNQTSSHTKDVINEIKQAIKHLTGKNG